MLEKRLLIVGLERKWNFKKFCRVDGFSFW